jgi:RNA polymerase sigma factor (sigma-70 family)
MTDTRLRIVVRHLRTLHDAQLLADAPDSELLERFAVRREEAAFAVLLRRHGPMVLGVGRRVLHQIQDAEDIFQATFLLLARKADAIRKLDAVGSWLHGVAYRLALRAKHQAIRRQFHEKQAGTMRQAQPVPEALQPDLHAILDDALHQLPDKYRTALVVCYLEGNTQQEAARKLGCPLGTVRSRLAQGRKLLRDRLARRGLILSTGIITTALAAEPAAATVPTALTAVTVRAALRFAAGQIVADVATAPVARLVEGGVLTMLGMKMKLVMALLLVAVFFTGVGVLGRHSPTERTAPAAEPPAAPSAEVVSLDLFRDITQQSGLRFTYRNGQEAGHCAILEAVGGGVGLIDYDGDGLLDIFVIGGGYYSGSEIKGHVNRLYRNLGSGHLRDVTHEVGLDPAPFYSHGCAVADYDRDGWPDLLVTGYGGVALYHNEPDGKGGRRFRDVTHKARLADEVTAQTTPPRRWATSAAWADLDGDGYADLYICQYVDWSLDSNQPETRSPNGAREIPSPKMYTGLPHRLFRNNGDGTFTEVSREAGLRSYTGDPHKDSLPGKGLGVVIVDLDGDGKPDIYVTNDTVDNFLYRNASTPGKIRLDELGMASGVARDDRGVPNGSSGTDAADYNGTGRASLFCANYENELHALYRNQGNGTFLFCSPQAGLAAIGQRFVGFGTGFLDLDNHGWEDLVLATGHVLRQPVGGPRSNGRCCCATEMVILRI